VTSRCAVLLGKVLPWYALFMGFAEMRDSELMIILLPKSNTKSNMHK
jgi:hypothetical protein